MGTSYTPLLMVGKIFENQDEAIEFLVNKNIITLNDGNEIKEAYRAGTYYLEEYLWKHDYYAKDKVKFPSAQTIDAVVGEGYVIGYLLCVWDLDKKPELFMTELEQFKKNWQHYFNEPAEINHIVEIV
jgi:hypothetical protein